MARKAESHLTPEHRRLTEDARRQQNWKRWGPYLAERQWGTVREDYSADGNCWDYFPHDHARSRAYRWGEDGLLGICDRECRLCFAIALWNGRDPILKERLFGLVNQEGNHGEDVKECYYYLDSSPTHSYMKGMYKYPQAEFPYERLVEENRRRNRDQTEFELLDTGVFNDNRYFDITAEYAKAAPDDILVRITATNRGPEAAALHLLPTLWLRNSWAWGCTHEGCEDKGWIRRSGAGSAEISHPTLGRFRWDLELRPRIAGRAVASSSPQMLFTDNETNINRIFGAENISGFVKDGINDCVVATRHGAVNPDGLGTKVAAVYILNIPAGETASVRLRLREPKGAARAFDDSFDRTIALRHRECEQFYASLTSRSAPQEQRRIARQAYAGLLWSKQFYHYVISDWIDGDPLQPPPPESHKHGRNTDWGHLFNRDIISMPDKWEYPWYAAWDLAFHMLPMSRLDARFAKDQLILMLREWYMHPNGQLPAYEFNFSDVNPPVHAWACWRVYKMTGRRGHRDRDFLARAFQKLLLNFTWWVNRKDISGRNIFGGGFLGLDNVGIFDRSRPLPGGGFLEQADGTAWMAFYCSTMMAIALELASEDSSYEDVASKFFEHFVSITNAINTLGGTGLWDEADGFYYDQLRAGDGRVIPLKLRSMVGIIPLFACHVLENDVLSRLPGFRKRMNWFMEHQTHLSRHITRRNAPGARTRAGERLLLGIPPQDRLVRVLQYVLDEREFLSPFGVRSLSKVHQDRPFVLKMDGQEFAAGYEPGECITNLFGGNSNWRGPVWLPVNYLLVEALERYHYFYGDSLKVECPTGSGRWMNLLEVSRELQRRLLGLFLPDAEGRRPCHGDEPRYASDPAWKDLVLFYEHFHGDTGRGLGANHQTGWTSLVALCVERLFGEKPKPRPASR